MGQYYHPIILGKRNGVLSWWYSHDFRNGLKLMEHSWLNNNFVNVVENYLTDNPQRIVWAGDYADNEKGKDYNLYDRCVDSKKILSGDETDLPAGMYVINHTKREYYSRDRLAASYDGWKVNPLPILTCEGNGRGGGDYNRRNGDDYLIGSWARDTIEVSSTAPDNYCDIDPYFYE